MQSNIIKSSIVIFLVTFIWFPTLAQEENEIIVESNVGSAIIYLDGAEVSRTSDVKLKKGRNILVFQKLTPHLDSRSIQVEVPENISILAVSEKKNFLSQEEDNPRIKGLKDSLEMVNQAINAIQDEKDAYNTEKQMLLKNQSLAGKDKGVAVAELKQAADFYRSRLLEINKKVTSLNSKLKDKQEVTTGLNNELRELNAKYNFRRTEISVLLYANSSQSIPVSIKYLVRKAGWTPSYDLKAEDVDNPIELVYKAKVYNNTEVDWENINITLSTSDPTQSASKPELKPWHLKYYTSSYGGVKSRKSKSLSIQKQGYIQNKNVGGAYSNEGETGEVIYNQVEVSELSAEFKIDVKYSVPSDNKPYLVDITEYELAADFKHFAIPKKDRDAFLLARITGWEQLDLVEGTANVYFGGTYVGKSYIDTRNVDDTLDLSLGRDNKILVTRKKLKEKSSTRLIGSNKKDLLVYEIIVKNNRKSTVNIELQDQLPVSQSSDVSVSVEELSGAEHNEDSGLLKWKFDLGPGESEKVKLSFSIKYPKTKQVKMKQTEMRSVRAF